MQWTEQARRPPAVVHCGINKLEYSHSHTPLVLPLTELCYKYGLSPNLSEATLVLNPSTNFNDGL